MTIQDAVAAFRNDLPHLEAMGISFHDGAPRPAAYLTEEFKRNPGLAMDAVSNIPAISTDPNSGIPSILTTLIDPQVYEILFAPNMAAEILGEVRKGSWVDDTAMFPVAEATGEVSSYGDFNNNGRAGVNTNFPQNQNYRFQIVKKYGELELERAGLAKINWVSEIDRAAAINLNKFLNFMYFFGVTGLQNYGLLNDPALSASLTPSTKAAGGTAWFSGNNANATANEVYNDILATYQQLVTQNGGLINMDSPLTLALSPASEVALGFTNTFNVNVRDLLAKNFKNLKVKQAVQYGVRTSGNPQGVLAGNLMQLIVDEVEGQKTGYCAFSEKMRAHPIIREMSAFQQKMSAGAWGAVLRYPAGISSMIGI